MEIAEPLASCDFSFNDFSLDHTQLCIEIFEITLQFWYLCLDITSIQFCNQIDRNISKSVS